MRLWNWDKLGHTTVKAEMITQKTTTGTKRLYTLLFIISLIYFYLLFLCEKVIWLNQTPNLLQKTMIEAAIFLWTYFKTNWNKKMILLDRAKQEAI